MANNSSDVTINLIANASRFQGGMRTGQNALRGFNTEARNTNTVASAARGGMNKLLATVGRLAAAYVGVAAAVRGFTSTVQTIASFEYAMARVEALTFASTDALIAMEAEARRLGAATMFSASEAADGLAYLSQAGFTAEQSIAALEATLNLAAAGSLGLGEAADITTNIMSGFSMAAEEAGRVADVLALIQARANTDVTGMGEAMKFVAPFANALGISLEETSAAIGVLANNGIKAGLAGRGLAAVMGLMINPNEKAQAALAAVGLTVKDINPEIVGLQTAISNLSKFDPQILAQMFGAANFDVVASLIKGVSTGALPELTAALEDAEGTAAKSAAIMSDTLTGAWRELNSAIEELMLGTGDSGLGGFFKNMVRDATEGVRTIQLGLAVVRNAMASGDIGRMFSLSLQLAGINFLNLLARAGTFVSGLVLSGLAPVIGVFGGLIQTINSTLMNAFLYAGNFLFERATAAALTVLEAVDKIPGVDLSGIIESVGNMNQLAQEGMEDAGSFFSQGFLDIFGENMQNLADPLLEVGADMMAGGDGMGGKAEIDTSGLQSELDDLIGDNWPAAVEDATTEGITDAVEGGGLPEPELTADQLAEEEAAKKAEEEAAKVAEKEAEKRRREEEAARKKAESEAKRAAEDAARREQRLRDATKIDEFRSVGGGGRAFNVGAFLGLGTNAGITALGAGAGGPLGAARVGGEREITVLNDIKALLQQIRDRITPSSGGGTGLQVSIET